MNATFDLDAYFERIRWRGEGRPTYGTLAGILRAHIEAIPFENLDVLLGRPIRLDLEGLQAKLVLARRGGYCFEQATLLAAALEALGFKLMRHTARVIVFQPREASPRAHMFLTVSLPEGTFIADPGFGPWSARVPIPLAQRAMVRNNSETHTVIRDADGRWVLHVEMPERAMDAWVSTLEEENLVDFEMGNHFTATHASSAFVNRIMLCARTEWGRVTVMNRDAILWRGAEAQQVELADRAQLRALLAAHFGFDLPEVEQIRVPSIPEWE